MRNPVPSPDLPLHYRRSLTTLLRFAAVMTVIGLLSGVLFQESAKRLGLDEVSPGLHLAATQGLAVLHGHVMLIAVLMPIAMAGALLIARRVGGRELGSKPLAWLTIGYLPFACITLALILYKGYHVLLAVRGGERNFATIDADFFGGLTGARYGVYGIAHVGMAVPLSVFVIALWRSLRGVGKAGA